MTGQGAPAFNPRVVLGLLLFGAIAFAATLYFIGAGETSRGPNDGGSHAAAKGLTGYAALAEILEAEGHEVSLSRSPGAFDDEALLILTPPVFADGEEIVELIGSRRYAGPTLVILPKWHAMTIPDAIPVEKEDGWVVLGGASKPSWIEALEGQYATELALGELDRTQGPDWQSGAHRGELPDPKHVQTIANATMIPLVTASNGNILAGYYDDGGYYPVLDEAAGLPPADEEDLDTSRWNFMVVAEPDLFDNYGMADRERAALAHEIVDLAMEGQDLPIVFDLTLNGLGRTQNLLTLAFAPPFLAATLCLALAMMVVAWRAFRRFGPPLAEARAIAFGKRRLVANSAALILRTRRLHLLTGPYVETVRQRLVAALRLRRSDDETLDHALDRRAPDAPGFAESAEALRQATRPNEILRAASALKSLERKLIR
ncbi:DUF4350 domain-containing protein [Pelagerythrobacter aerophilus]|uniref:DUF4350 domain-containing protein n=1 Tax=Pelagerythrobacter aerophilus TaxID=2306995 RepID=A0A418NCY3_9SPHN|nr:DUF4350 domain-containing protein [Pelagerythrobacter aerophilus]RIV75672.1 DUF4350 domain-containing protein [Pelagerythrobacter aerophilus]